jgi:hypothetical protein
MLRLIQVKELEDRRRVLLAESEIYRRTLILEAANLKYSASLIAQKFSPVKAAYRLLKNSAPLVAGLLLARKRAVEARGGFVSKVFSGIQMAGQLMSLFRKKPEPETAATDHAEVV